MNTTDRRDLAPGYTFAVLDSAPHESAEAARREEERLRRTWTAPVRAVTRPEREEVAA
jgi:hypothetical protein